MRRTDMALFAAAGSLLLLLVLDARLSGAAEIFSAYAQAVLVLCLVGLFATSASLRVFRPELRALGASVLMAILSLGSIHTRTAGVAVIPDCRRSSNGNRRSP